MRVATDIGGFYHLYIIMCMIKSGHLSLFEKNNAVIDVKCTNDDVIFSETARSVVECQAICDSISGCYSTFFKVGTKSCFGCRGVYDTSSGLPAEVGTLYYSKPAPLCPSDWSHFENTCYLLVTELRSQSASQAHCEAAHPGAHLVDIKTIQEMTFLRDLYNTVTSQGIQRVWIGAFTSSPTGPEAYRWTDGDYMTDGYYNFLFTYIRSCVFFDPTRDFVWENAPCSRSYYSVCEFDI